MIRMSTENLKFIAYYHDIMFNFDYIISGASVTGEIA